MVAWSIKRAAGPAAGGELANSRRRAAQESGMEKQAVGQGKQLAAATRGVQYR